MQGTLFDLNSAGPALLEERNEVRHFGLSCKSILNYCDTERMPDTFTINPYRGCEFGCRYCYARYTHEFMDLDGEDFERKIFVKSEAPRVLQRTLDQQKLLGRHIAIGTATDPYQPAEARFQLTRGLLEVLSRARRLSLSITTKSALARRDIDLFQRISRRNDFQVNISLISLDELLLRRLEPMASRAAARLSALSQISQAGVSTGIFLMPILPSITDSSRSLESVIWAARENGARYVGSNGLFLRASSKKIFFKFLCETRPDLYSKYSQIYGRHAYASRRYRAHISELVHRLKRKYGFSPVMRQKEKKEAQVAFQQRLNGLTPANGNVHS